MKGWLTQRATLALSAGLLLGLICGAVVATSAYLVLQSQSGARFELPAYAVATDSSDSFAIATGPIAEGVEGVFILDFLTGELSCAVINPRNGQLAGVFKHLVAADLATGQADKAPRYLMVTGNGSLRTTGGTVRPADSLVYVADANSGRYAVYAIPWNRNAAVNNVPQNGAMMLLFKGNVRDPAAIRQ